MANIDNTAAGLELAQIGWVVGNIEAAVKFFGNAMGIAGFPPPETFRAQDIGQTSYGQAVDG
jgi:methylmalonyl-CoA/ethylmalonyl-CoA epimerase